MKIIQVPLSKIHRDESQPRQTFNPDKIAELAQTIKTSGIINLVEVSAEKNGTFKIITGENRTRAAKVAGLDKIYVKVLDIDDQDRFMRQVIENIQYANLTDWEIANALKKLLPKKGSTSLGEVDYDTASLPNDLKHKSEYFKGVRWLANKIGKSESWISEHLALLEASEEFQTASKQGLVSTRILRNIKSLPKEYQKVLERKILNGEFANRSASQEVIIAINRDPDKAKEILAVDFSKYPDASQLAEALSKITPRLSDTILAGQTPYDQIYAIQKELIRWCNTTTPQKIGKMRFQGVLVTLSTIKSEIDAWVKGVDKLSLDTKKVKQIE